MSKNLKGKMVLIGCGGAGVNVVGNLNDHLRKLGDGFANVVTEYLDSSDANIRNFTHNEKNFFMIKSDKLGKNISGSGGIRRTNMLEIKKGVMDYVNEKNFSKDELATYYFIVYSASGGTGSMAGPMLHKHLADAGLPVVSVVIGDSSSDDYVKHTLEVLGSLSNMAIKSGKPYSIIYNDNNMNGTNSVKENKAITDKNIFRVLGNISAFISGDASEIDQKDMAIFFDQSIRYIVPKNIEKNPPGLYHIETFQKEVPKLPDYYNVTGVRTLSTRDDDITLDMVPSHVKHGETENYNVIETFKEAMPLYLITYTNYFSAIEMKLTEIKDGIDKNASRITVDNISMLDDSEEDDSGMFC